MQYTTYLLLIGAAAAQECINTAITEASATNAEKTGLFATELAKKTPEVEAFEAELKVAQDHVNDMIIEDKLAKIGKDQEEMTKAATNLSGAQTILDQLIAKDGNAALNKILVDLENAQEEKAAAELAYTKAINMCIPATHQEYHDEQLAAKKVEVGYDAMSAEDKASFDEKHETMMAARNEKTAEVRMVAEYHNMSQFEKETFDKLLLAQWKVQKQQKEELSTHVDKQDMTKEQFDALTDEEKKAAMEKMKDMRSMFEQKRDEREMSNMELRKKAGYFTTMSKEQRALFDSKLSERNTRSEGDMAKMFDKFEQAQGDMTEEQKKKFMSQGIDMMKMMASRDQKFDDHDFQQRIKMGYFSKMSEGERGQFDDNQRTLRNQRQGDFSKMDEKIAELKKSGKFDDMSEEDQKKFMSMFMMQMGSNMQQMMKDREEDDDMRQRMGYFKQDQAGRDKADQQIRFQQGKRTESRMPVMQGESKSVCYPSQYYDDKNGYMGGKDGVRKDMMEDMMRDGMKDGDSEGMMKGGMEGPGKMMMDKMNGMEGMLDKMGQMSDKDQLQMKQRLQGMKDGNMMDQMKGGMDGMRDGMRDMMQQKFNGMMNPDGQEDLMSKMGGKEGIMNMMGMTRGTDRDGNDMKQKFEGMMQKRQGQSSGPMSGEQFMQKREEMKGMQKSFNGGCAENLCCGHILSFGVWAEDYFCYDQYAIDVDGANMFKCVEGLAKNMAAGAATLLAAAFMMQ